MRGIDMVRTNPRARTALLAALGLLIGGGVGGVALAQSGRQDKPPYRSSIQVPDDADEEGEENEADVDDEDADAPRGKAAGEREEDDAAEARAEAAESARLQPLARVTADQARSAALAKVPGTATLVELENEDGNLVYGVVVRTAAGERDVKVDAGNGRVLHVETHEQDD